MTGNSFFGKIATRLMGGFGLVIILLLVCTAAGYLGISKTGSMLNFLTGPAWSTADGAMEGVIETESQMLGVYATISGEKLESKDQDITIAGEAAKEAFGRVRKAGLLPDNMINRLDELHKTYELELGDLLEAYEAKKLARKTWNDSSEAVEELLVSVATLATDSKQRKLSQA